MIVKNFLFCTITMIIYLYGVAARKTCDGKASLVQTDDGLLTLSVSGCEKCEGSHAEKDVSLMEKGNCVLKPSVNPSGMITLSVDDLCVCARAGMSVTTSAEEMSLATYATTPTTITSTESEITKFMKPESSDSTTDNVASPKELEADKYENDTIVKSEEHSTKKDAMLKETDLSKEIMNGTISEISSVPTDASYFTPPADSDEVKRTGSRASIEKLVAVSESSTDRVSIAVTSIKTTTPEPAGTEFMASDTTTELSTSKLIYRSSLPESDDDLKISPTKSTKSLNRTNLSTTSENYGKSGNLSETEFDSYIASKVTTTLNPNKTLVKSDHTLPTNSTTPKFVRYSVTDKYFVPSETDRIKLINESSTYEADKLLTTDDFTSPTVMEITLDVSSEASYFTPLNKSEISLFLSSSTTSKSGVYFLGSNFTSATESDDYEVTNSRTNRPLYGVTSDISDYTSPIETNVSEVTNRVTITPNSVVSLEISPLTEPDVLWVTHANTTTRKSGATSSLYDSTSPKNPYIFGVATNNTVTPESNTTSLTSDFTPMTESDTFWFLRWNITSTTSSFISNVSDSRSTTEAGIIWGRNKNITTPKTSLSSSSKKPDAALVTRNKSTTPKSFSYWVTSTLPKTRVVASSTKLWVTSKPLTSANKDMNEEEKENASAISIIVILVLFVVIILAAYAIYTIYKHYRSGSFVLPPTPHHDPEINDSKL